MVSLSLPPIALGTGAIIAILIFAGVSIATVIAFITKNIGVILILLVFWFLIRAVGRRRQN